MVMGQHEDKKGSHHRIIMINGRYNEFSVKDLAKALTVSIETVTLWL